jgi:DNA-binding IclR family transcriptional regulator
LRAAGGRAVPHVATPAGNADVSRETAMKRSKGIQSVEQGYKLLQCLERAGQPLPLKELARGAGMSPSTAHFYLASYIRTGLVVQAVSGGHYDLGPAALRLGLAALARLDIVRRAREAMFELHEQIEGAILLTVWGNLGPTVVYHLEGAHRSPLEGRVGTVLPMLSSAGCAFISYFPSKERAAIIAAELSRPLVFTSTRLKSRKEVDRILHAVRRYGVARIPGLYGQGYAAASAPVFDHEGTVRVVLTVLVDRKHTDLRLGGSTVQALLNATQRVTADIGGHGRVPPI